MNLPVPAKQKAHSEIGASGAHRWFECPGSVILSRNAQATESESARRGTAAHQLAEHCLRNGKDPDQYIGEEFYGVEVDEKMIDGVQVYVDVVRADMAMPHDLFGLEASLTLPQLDERVHGTTDNFIGQRGKWLRVRDYKNGVGYVDAVDNVQGLYYLLLIAVSFNLEFEEYEIEIVQPNAINAEPTRTWKLDNARLKRFYKELKAAIARVEAQEGRSHDRLDLKAGDWCTFCPAAGFCPEFKNKAHSQAMTQFGSEYAAPKQPPHPADMSLDQLGAVLCQADFIEGWISSVRKHANNLAQTGIIPTGMKLRERTGRRRWGATPEEIIENVQLFLGRRQTQEYFEEPKIKSPAKMEKLLGKRYNYLVDSMSERPDIGVELVPLVKQGDPVEAPVLTQFTDETKSNPQDNPEGGYIWEL